MTSVPQDETLFWQQPAPVLMEQIGSSPSGLTGAEAAARLARSGPNQVHATKKGAVLLQYLSRFRNPLVIILLVASCILALTGDLTGFFIISTIILVSVTLDFVQEHRAGEAAERLRQSVAVRVQVLRDGHASNVALEELVPGDVVLLAAGDLIPGDGRVLEAKDFFLTQALRDGLGSLDSRGRILSGGPPWFTSLPLSWAACLNKPHQAFCCQALDDAAICYIDQTTA